jgi:hypothetical protein
MNKMMTLTSALLDLLNELEGTKVPLIIGGGYGIYLRYMMIMEERRQTLFKELPEPRSTNDLDLFLRAELLLDSEQLRPLRNAMTQLGYEVVKGGEHYQFLRPGPNGDEERGIKIDVLTGPTSPFKGTPVQFDKRRVRPRPSVDLHAHPCEEALTLTENTTLRRLHGKLSNGRDYVGQVLLPHPFTFLTMKLFALRDRHNDAEKDFGRHHALDLYTVIGSMVEHEWNESLSLRTRHRADAILIESSHIVGELFSGMDTMGTIRLRESAYFRQDFRVTEFLDALKELFGAKP